MQSSSSSLTVEDIDGTWPPRIHHSSSLSRHHFSPSGRWPSGDTEAGPIPIGSVGGKPLVPLVGNTNLPEKVELSDWSGYPQSLFRNWTFDSMRRRGVEQACAGKVDEGGKEIPCEIYFLDLKFGGRVSTPYKCLLCEDPMTVWESFNQNPSSGVQVRSMFIENLSESVLQMLGTRFRIDPYFFISSASWTPALHQDKPSTQGDHITITLTFPSIIRNPLRCPLPVSPFLRIDTRAPLDLHSSGRLLFVDLLAIYMIRMGDSGIIVSNHPPSELRMTSAQHLCSRMRIASQSIVWQNIFRTSRDPTFVILMMLWHPLSAWDTALDALYQHFVSLETRLMARRDEDITQELHVIRPHLFRYFSLLEDFRKTVLFIAGTPNPGLNAWPSDERNASIELLTKECNALLSEIDRLEMRREILDKRLANVLSLVSSSFNFVTSRQTRELTEAAVRDSAAMKQISYLTMVFLPASFVASIFGMNIREFNRDSYSSFVTYVAAAIPLTVVTIWIIIAFQSKHYPNGPDASLWTRTCWPIVFLSRLFVKVRDQVRRGIGRDSLV